MASRCCGHKRSYTIGLSSSDTIGSREDLKAIKQIFINKIRNKVNEIYIPLVTRFFPIDQREDLYETLIQNYHLRIILHEIGHTVGKFEGYTTDALGAQYLPFEEIRAESSAYIIAAHREQEQLLPKGFLDQIITINIIVYLHMRYIYEKTGDRSAYQRFLSCLLRPAIENNTNITKCGHIFTNREKNKEKVLHRARKVLQISKEIDISKIQKILSPKKNHEEHIQVLINECKKKKIKIKPDH